MCIDLDNVAFDSSAMESLVNNFPRLQSMRLANRQDKPITMVRHLLRCSCLTSCVIDMDTEFVESLLRDKPNFIKLAVPSCKGLNGSVMSIIAKYCPLIRHVDVSKNALILRSDVEDLLDECKQLLTLNLERCSNVRLPAVSLSNRRMRSLNVRDCNISWSIMENFLVTSNFQCAKIEYNANPE